MEKEIETINAEVITAQKDAVLKEVATLSLQLEFIQKELEEKEEEAKAIKDKKAKETQVEAIAQQRLQRVIPMKDNIAYKTKYYEFLSAKN